MKRLPHYTPDDHVDFCLKRFAELMDEMVFEQTTGLEGLVLHAYLTLRSAMAYQASARLQAFVRPPGAAG